MLREGWKEQHSQKWEQSNGGRSRCSSNSTTLSLFSLSLSSLSFWGELFCNLNFSSHWWILLLNFSVLTCESDFCILCVELGFKACLDQVMSFLVWGFWVNFVCGSVQPPRVDPLWLFFKNYLNTCNLNLDSHWWI